MIAKGNAHIHIICPMHVRDGIEALARERNHSVSGVASVALETFLDRERQGKEVALIAGLRARGKTDAEIAAFLNDGSVTNAQEDAMAST